MFQIHFPMELHLVHKNNDLGKTFNDAVKASAYNSLAVLGIMFEVQEDDNPKLKPLVKGNFLKDCIFSKQPSCFLFIYHARELHNLLHPPT